MNEWPREIGGETAWERAVNLAGLLAERGVGRIEVVSPTERRVLLARRTDLVGEIVRMADQGGGELRADGITVVITPASIATHG